MPTPSRRTLRSLAACIVAVALVGAACGDDDEPSPPGTGPTTTDPTTTLSPEQEDEQALRRLADEWFEAVRKVFVDGEDPTIAEDYITGDYLTEFRQQVDDYTDSGQSTERDPEGRTKTVVTSVTVEGDRAEVEECVVNADVLLDANTGSVIDDSVGVRYYLTLAERTEGEWRFTSRATREPEGDSRSCG